MAFEFIGPCKVYLGNPVVAAGAGMTDLGDAEDVAFDPGVRMSFTSNAELAGVPKASGIYALPSMPRVQMQLKDGALATLAEILLDSKVTSGALGGADAFAKIADVDVPTLALVPYLQGSDGEDAANAIWLPAAVADQVNGFTFNRPQAGEIGNAYNVQLFGGYREEDQGDASVPTAAANIPVNNRTWFMGPPDDLGLVWLLP